ncbi:MAG TPA: hypothetical protein VNB49_17955, partial [Candidatus Dormibacteraeota bacterium]|nr:hypothetical protein [Candidatus Dormibacteraeota bacterium]
SPDFSQIFSSAIESVFDGPFHPLQYLALDSDQPTASSRLDCGRDSGPGFEFAARAADTSPCSAERLKISG